MGTWHLREEGLCTLKARREALRGRLWDSPKTGVFAGSGNQEGLPGGGVIASDLEAGQGSRRKSSAGHEGRQEDLNQGNKEFLL